MPAERHRPQGDRRGPEESPEQDWWFVQRFEERKRREAEARARREQGGDGGSGGGGSGGDSATTAAAATTVAKKAEAVAADSAAAADSAPAAASERRPPPPAEWRRAAALQCAQLAAGLAALILLPAALAPGGVGLSWPRPWLLFAAYFAFFAAGTVRRTLLHGPLTRRADDAQRRSPGGRAALAAFVTAMPLIHYPPMLRWAARQAAAATAPLGPAAVAASAKAGGLALYDVAGAALIAAAAALNWWAASSLGEAYDRVSAPKALVTSGPYALAQHPIYGSYMLLFAGFCLACHSAPFAVLAAWVCALYYRRRAALEAEVLREAFGRAYEDYAAATPRRFVPWVA